MEISNCVLVVKETVMSQNARAARLATRGDITAHRLIRAHSDHRRTADVVRKELRRRGIDYVEMVPHKFTASEKRTLSSADFIVTVGGDGTVLGSSHYVRDGVMLGVNSAPHDSIGYFCFVDKSEFAKKLDDCISSRLRPMRLARLKVALDDKQLPELALNDVLLAHEHPAATTRYIIEIGDRREEQRCSGIWVSTAAGSTAGIRSAGGHVLPLGSNRIQYLVRELYRELNKVYELTHGFIRPGQVLTLASKMPEGRLYIDGSRTAYRFPFGTRASLRVAEIKLNIFLRDTIKR